MEKNIPISELFPVTVLNNEAGRTIFASEDVPF